MIQSIVKRGALALAVATAGVAGYHARGVVTVPGAVPVATASEGAAPPAPPRSTPVARPDFSEIVRRYGPAVVNVSTTGVAQAGMAAAPDGGEGLAPFFHGFGVPAPRVPVRGLGSGFVVDPDGIILTNAHVVLGASKVRVKLTDGRELTAKVVGLDRPTDVAVLRVDAKGLPSVQLGDPSRTQVGEWVLAIGSPFGFENSATAGIVSAKARSLPDEGYVPFLQTDVAVNPGNSGGPLFDAAGEVIGINSQIYSSSGGYQGLSFAIPIDVAMKTERQLVAHGKVVRGRLGVTVQDVDDALAHAFHLERRAGALVSSVEEGGAAARAGVQPGDVILRVNGKEISRSAELPPLVADLAPGSDARLDVWRQGAKRSLDVKVGEQPGAKVASANGQEHGRLGLVVRPVAPDEGRGGVVVQSAEGPAAQAGIQQGDVLLAVNGKPITGIAQLRALVRDAGKDVALLVQRGDATLFVPVELG